ncbi:hypothetical protein UlMin_001505 [Ulmus minor]
MDQMLKAAAEEGNIDKLYTLHTHFVMEIMRLKPSFARKQNQDGFTPMHLALQHGKTKMIHRLVDMDCDIVRTKGREGKTPLHYAAEEGNLHLLTKFLLACPQSIQDVTIRGETALHIAVKNYNLEDFDLMVGRLRRARHEGAKIQVTTILNWKDEEGNTALHIAALTNQPQSLQVKTLPQKKSATSFMRFKTNIKEDTRNVQLVVAILIVTATYQSALRPPGGVWQDDNNNSTISNRTHKLVPEYEGKAILTITHSITVLTIVFLLPSRQISTLLLVAIYLFSYCFALSMLIISPVSLYPFVNYVPLSTGPFSIGALIFSYKLNKKLYKKKIS